MSPLIYEPHRCDLPMESEGVGSYTYTTSEPAHRVGAIWECDECGRRWQVVNNDVLSRFFDGPPRIWVTTQNQTPMHGPVDDDHDTERSAT